MTNKGLLVIFSGPSGTGKGTVLKSYFAHHPEAKLSVSATTRQPRLGEQNGREYYFVTKEKFAEMKSENALLENAEYCGNCYGTPRAPIESWLKKGYNVFLEIEVQGGAQVRKLLPDSIGIFILPPSVQELGNRLRGRKTESEDAIQKRLNTAKREIQQAAQYDYVVVNDTVEKAAAQVAEIISSEKYKTSRNSALIERVLNND
ncbi:MAG TPA: guanylate kinase [Ruminococcaceae bacterium]|jgi:guanylate kinase|nr:guanylate kinase [Oscillospiraceae bacterium]HCC02143.1 guanylate kinase [Oscillospiraceae bacterium]